MITEIATSTIRSSLILPPRFNAVFSDRRDKLRYGYDDRDEPVIFTGRSHAFFHMDQLCVYCGSSEGQNPVYLDAASTLGRTLVAQGIGLVYGGGHVGLMGAVADAVVDAGGEAFGVMPEALVDREIAHEGLTELYVVDSMHARKERMAALSDGFVALPGGFGTLEELMEVLTWAQLGFHRNPCGFLNVADYYTQLVAFFDQQVEAGFVSEDHRTMVVVTDNVEDLLDQFDAYDPPAVKEYITDKSET